MDSRVKANLDFPAEVPELHVSATFRRNLLLVVREMLHNAIKHSDATEVAITLRATSDTLFLTLKDNGKGFDTANVKSNVGGFGLVGLKERADLLNGEFFIDSRVRVVSPDSFWPDRVEQRLRRFVLHDYRLSRTACFRRVN